MSSLYLKIYGGAGISARRDEKLSLTPCDKEANFLNDFDVYAAKGNMFNKYATAGWPLASSRWTGDGKKTAIESALVRIGIIKEYLDDKERAIEGALVRNGIMEACFDGNEEKSVGKEDDAENGMRYLGTEFKQSDMGTESTAKSRAAPATVKDLMDGPVSYDGGRPRHGGPQYGVHGCGGHRPPGSDAYGGVPQHSVLAVRLEAAKKQRRPR